MDSWIQEEPQWGFLYPPPAPQIQEMTQLGSFPSKSKKASMGFLHPPPGPQIQEGTQWGSLYPGRASMEFLPQPNEHLQILGILQ